MTARSSSAYVLSITVHLTVALLLGLLAYETDKPASVAPKILELVAGAGNNYAATEAPKLGSPDGIKVSIPDVKPLPTPPDPTPPAPIEAAPPEQPPVNPVKPAPVEKKPVAKMPVTKTGTKPIDPSHNFAKDFKRIEQKRTKRLLDQYQKQIAAQEAREKALAKARAARIDAEGIREGVEGGSAANKTGGAGGKALTRDDGPLLDSYFALLEARIKENLVTPDGLSDSVSAKVEFYVGADGSISRVHIVKSSGNAEFDHAVVAAFSKTQSVGRRPDGKGDTSVLEIRAHEENS